MNLTICPWKYGKRWVYSVTYDEALEELHRFAIPHHEELGIPGHVEAVAGHLGAVRQLGQSSYNGFHHMGPVGLQDLIARGWGVGNHSWSHELIGPDDVGRELGDAKKTLEDAIQAPVCLYCAPGNNYNMADHILEAARSFGYLGAMSITDALNRPTEELFWLNRTALHVEYYEPFFSEYDPFRNIRYAQERSGWIIDYCHCPLKEAVHPHKDCTEAQLRLRFDTVLGEGGDEVWCANPDEVIQYHRTRRACSIDPLPTPDGSEEEAYRLRLAELPDGRMCTDLTFDITTRAAWCAEPLVCIDDVEQVPSLVRPRTLRCTAPVRDGTVVRVGPRRRNTGGKAQ